MRRPGFLVGSFLLVLLVPSGVAAQGPGRWSAHLALARESFSGASRDTSTIPGSSVDVFPASRLVVEAGLGRRFGAWEVSLAASYAPGDLRAQTSTLTLDDRSGGVDRYRGILRLGREVMRLEAARLVLEGGIAVDRWELSGLGNRTALTGLGGVRLRIPLGRRVALEQSALFAVGGSPFPKRALPPEAVVSSLKTWSLGLGLRRGW